MTPELAAENAAQVLDKAAAMYAFPEEAAALVAVADGWTRLHTALATTQARDFLAVKTEPVTVHIDPAIAGDVDPKTIAESVAVALGKPIPQPEIGVYRERAALVAHLAALYPAAIVIGADPAEPDWPVIFIDTPKGQMSWHLSENDLDLFHFVTSWPADAVDAPKWDGHTTAEKYERLAALVRDMMTH